MNDIVEWDHQSMTTSKPAKLPGGRSISDREEREAGGPSGTRPFSYAVIAFRFRSCNSSVPRGPNCPRLSPPNGSTACDPDPADVAGGRWRGGYEGAGLDEITPQAAP